MNVSDMEGGGEKQLKDLVFSEDRKNHQKAIDQYFYMANSFIASK
jgi:hypothetical protein